MLAAARQPASLRGSPREALSGSCSRPPDPGVFASIAAVLGLTSLAAALIPARRAVTVDPVTALRQG